MAPSACQRPLRRSVRLAPLAAGLVGLALLAAGCGGGTSPSAVADIGTTDTAATTTSGGSQATPPTAQSKEDAAFAFSKCMRANGVPKFPDPQTSGNGIRLSIGPGSGVDPSSPTFKTAQQKCQKLLPNGGKPTPAQQAKIEKQALAFSACMRSHGVPKFPDPDFSGGGVRIAIHAGSGIDPSSPAFQNAQKACQGKLPGVAGGKTSSGKAP